MTLLEHINTRTPLPRPQDLKFPTGGGRRFALRKSRIEIVEMIISCMMQDKKACKIGEKRLSVEKCKCHLFEGVISAHRWCPKSVLQTVNAISEAIGRPNPAELARIFALSPSPTIIDWLIDTLEAWDAVWLAEAEGDSVNCVANIPALDCYIPPHIEEKLVKRAARRFAVTKAVWE